MVSKARPSALPGLATKNYFSVLAREWRRDKKDVEVVGNPEHAKGVQINTMKTRIPEEVAISKEAALFILNRYTNVEKAERPTRNGEVEELWKLMSKMLSTQSDRTSWSKLKRT